MNKIILLGIITMLLLISTVSAGDITGYSMPDNNSLADYTLTSRNNYSFESTAGTLTNPEYTLLSDHSGNGNDMTASGYTANNGALQNGVIVNSTGMHFDGVDDSVQTTNVLNNETFSISFWYYANEYEQNNGFIGNDLASDRGFTLMQSVSKYRLNLRKSDDSASLLDVSFGSIKVNNWTHISIIKNGMTITAYENKILILNTTVTEPTMRINSQDLYFGRSFYDNLQVRFFNGSLSNVRIYDFALNSTQITADMNSALPFERTVMAYDTPNTNWYNSTHVLDNNAYVAGNDGYNSISDIGYAATFDGDDDYQSLGVLNIMTKNAGTVSMWIKPAIIEVAGQGTLFYQNTDKLILYQRDNKIGFAYLDGGWQSISYTVAGLENQWLHIVGTTDNGVLKLYLNSISVSSTAQSPFWAGDSGTFIGIQKPSNYLFNGSIDNVQIYNRSLSQSEITNIYNNERLTDGLVFDGQIEYFPRVDINEEYNITSTNHFTLEDQTLDLKNNNTVYLWHYPAITLINAWNSSSILQFSAIVNSITYSTTNGIMYVPINSSQSTKLISSSYLNKTVVHDYTDSTNLSNSLGQSSINLSVYELITNNSLDNLTITTKDTNSYLATHDNTTSVSSLAEEWLGVQVSVNETVYLNGFTTGLNTNATICKVFDDSEGLVNPVTATALYTCTTTDGNYFSFENDARLIQGKDYAIMLSTFGGVNGTNYYTNVIVPVTDGRMTWENGRRNAATNPNIFMIKTISYNTEKELTTNIPFNTGNYSLFIDKDDYYNKSFDITITTQETSTKILEGLYNSLITFNLEEYFTNSTILNYTIIANYTNQVITTTTNGILELPLIKNVITLYNVTATGYAGLYNQLITPTLSEQDVNITMFTFNSININVYNGTSTDDLLDDDVTISVISNLSSFSVTNNTGEFIVDLLQPNNYELRVSSDGYNTQSKYVIVTNDSTSNINIFMIVNTSTELQRIRVVDEGNNVIEGAIVRLQKEVINETEQFITIQEAVTNFNGETALNVLRSTEDFYRFAVIIDSDPKPILPDGNLFTGKTIFIPGVDDIIQLQVSIGETIDDGLVDLLSVDYDVTFSGANNSTVTYTWVDGANTISGGRLLVTGQYINVSLNESILFDSTISSFNGNLSYTLPFINNTKYTISAYIVYDDYETLVYQTKIMYGSDVVTNKNTGMFFAAILVAFIAILTLKFGPLISSVFSVASIIGLNILNLTNIPTTIITSFIAMFILLFLKSRSGDK